jgi:predicted phage terminase large subunit-like protein
MARRLLIAATKRKITVLCTRELQKSIKDSVHKLLVEQIEMCGLQGNFEWNKTQLRSKIGSEFLFYGLRYNPDEIKSTEGVDICWLEEAQATSQDSLDMLIPTIRKPGSEIWVTYNPKFEDDPIHHMFCVEGRDNAIVRHVNYDENPWFPDVLRVEMEQLRRINPKLARRIWDGEVVEIGGGDYFPSDKVNYIDEAPHMNKIVRAWDLAATQPSDENPDPDYTAGVKMGIDSEGRVIVLDVRIERINANDVRNMVRGTAEMEPDVIIRVPQDPGQAGKEQAESYRRMLGQFSIKTERVTGNKETRSESLSAQWHAGNVYLVCAPWNAFYLRMMNAFPTPDVHDDVVDASNDAYSEIALGSTYTLANL